jgi:hypothetical protein
MFIVVPYIGKGHSGQPSLEAKQKDCHVSTASCAVERHLLKKRFLLMSRVSRHKDIFLIYKL